RGGAAAARPPRAARPPPPAAPLRLAPDTASPPPHPSWQDVLRRGWIAGSSPAMTERMARSPLPVTRGLDPRVHHLRKNFCEGDGLPGHKRVHARLRRAMPGNDERGRGADRVNGAVEALTRRRAGGGRP